jgi:hypothetical protein
MMEIYSRTQLIELMKHLELPLTAAEVGVAEGIWSTELMGLGLDRLYLIDIWERVPFIAGCASFSQEWHDKNYNEVLERMKGYGDKVVVLKGFSYKVANEIPDESLGLVYVDGDHTRLGCHADIEVYYPKLVKGGIMAFHDYGNKDYGVFDAVETYTQINKLQIHRLPETGDPSHLGCYFFKQ